MKRIILAAVAVLALSSCSPVGVDIPGAPNPVVSEDATRGPLPFEAVDVKYLPTGAPVDEDALEAAQAVIDAYIAWRAAGGAEGQAGATDGGVFQPPSSPSTGGNGSSGGGSTGGGSTGGGSTGGGSTGGGDTGGGSTSEPPPPPPPPPPAFEPWSTNEYYAGDTGGFCSGINTERTNNSLATLSSCGESSTLMSHAQAMAQSNSVYHSGSDNIVGANKTMSGLMAAFMASSGHRAHILGNYTSATVGCYVWKHTYQTAEANPVTTKTVTFCAAKFAS